MRTCLVLLLLTLSGSPALHAQRHAYRHAIGRPYVYEYRSTSTHNQEFGEASFQMKSESMKRMQVTVYSVSGDTLHISVRILSASETLESPMGKQDVGGSDSGMVYGYTWTPDSGLQVAAHGKSIGDAIQHCFPRLDGEKLKPGDSWNVKTRTTRNDSAYSVDGTGSIAYTVKDSQTVKGRACYSIHGVTNNQSHSTVTMKSMTVGLDTQSEGTVDIVYDLERGIILSVTAGTESVMEVGGSAGTSRMSQSEVLTLVE